MSAKYIKRHMHPQTREMMDTVMSDSVYAPTVEIALRLGQTRRAVEQKLVRLYEKGFVERIGENVEGGGLRYLWRKVPAGYTAPLYDAQPGVDGRALDEVLGGFTYLKRNLSERLTCQASTR